jgi:hypothetical protein
MERISEMRILFPEITGVCISDLSIDHSLKSSYTKATPVGKLIPLEIDLTKKSNSTTFSQLSATRSPKSSPQISIKEQNMKNENQIGIAGFWSSRPKLPILLICLFETLGLLLIPGAIFSKEASAIGLLYQIYIGLTSLMTITIIYLLWRMSKKGMIVYLAAYTIHNTVALFAGNWMVGVLIIPVIGMILILISLKHFVVEGARS